jgi:hypothetical protein
LLHLVAVVELALSVEMQVELLVVLVVLELHPQLLAHP